MNVEHEFLAKAWGAVSASPLPDAVKKAFQAQIVPLLKVTPLTDPYIVDATNKMIIAYYMGQAVEVLERNAATAEELEDVINGTMKTKLILKASTIVTGTVIAAATLAVLSFGAGSALGGLGSEWWAKRDMAKIQAEADYKAARLDFLEGVNADLMTCKNGEIVKQDNGKRACFYHDKGWFIE